MKIDRLIICVFLALLAFAVCGCDESSAAEPNDWETHCPDCGIFCGQWTEDGITGKYQHKKGCIAPFDVTLMPSRKSFYRKLAETNAEPNEPEIKLSYETIYVCRECRGVTPSIWIVLSHNCKSTITGEDELPTKIYFKDKYEKI